MPTKAQKKTQAQKTQKRRLIFKGITDAISIQERNQRRTTLSDWTDPDPWKDMDNPWFDAWDD